MPLYSVTACRHESSDSASSVVETVIREVTAPREGLATTRLHFGQPFSAPLMGAFVSYEVRLIHE